MDDARSIQEILFAHEQSFIQPPQAISRTEIESLLAEDFCETGASGGTCSRIEGIAALMQRTITPPTNEWHISNFSARAVTDGCYLTNYILTQPARVTRRATIWRLDGAFWRAVFHQGTILH